MKRMNYIGKKKGKKDLVGTYFYCFCTPVLLFLYSGIYTYISTPLFTTVMILPHMTMYMSPFIKTGLNYSPSKISAATASPKAYIGAW
jgi:hypothetical protein